MSNQLKDWMFYNAMLAASFDAAEEDPIKIPFHFKLAVVHNKPCVVLDIKVLGTHTSDSQRTVHHVPIAMPLYNQVNEVTIPHTANQRIFDFQGLKVGQPWLDIAMQQQDQQRIRDIASYIVAETHLVPMKRKNLNYLIGSEIGPMFNAVLLIQLGDKTSLSDSIASYDPATGCVSSSPFLGFPEIYTRKHSLSGDLIVQCQKRGIFRPKTSWLHGLMQATPPTCIRSIPTNLSGSTARARRRKLEHHPHLFDLLPPGDMLCPCRA